MPKLSFAEYRFRLRENFRKLTDTSYETEKEAAERRRLFYIFRRRFLELFGDRLKDLQDDERIMLRCKLCLQRDPFRIIADPDPRPRVCAPPPDPDELLRLLGETA